MRAIINLGDTVGIRPSMSMIGETQNLQLHRLARVASCTGSCYTLLRGSDMEGLSSRRVNSNLLETISQRIVRFHIQFRPLEGRRAGHPGKRFEEVRSDTVRAVEHVLAYRLS